MSEKPLCVLGVLRTDLGLAIKAEMLKWLLPNYEVICVEQESPGIMFEYPALKTAAAISVARNEPVLYLHTKGASNPVVYRHQVMVRRLWADQFTNNKAAYFSAVNVEEPMIACPYIGDKRQTWWNGMVINQFAAQNILDKMELTDRRHYYEEMCDEINIKVVGILQDKAIPNDDMIKLTLGL